VDVKIIRRTGNDGYSVDGHEFYPKTLEALELHYAPNHALRVTREELSEILTALQPDLECRDGIIDLIKPREKG
jgi:hypothetical protein